MTATRARFAAAVVIVTTAAAVLAGCGGGGHPDAARDRATPAGERPASSAPAIGPDGTAEPSASASAGSGGSGGANGATAKESTLPRSQLTPATGTFTDQQKSYLVGKVPKGMDPAAVLQTGQESCDRIANTADASPKLAKEAIADGEIADAKDAITYLCPKYKSLLP
ncbi:hypothetical protein [Streptomyces sp. CBMA29]|uniref:hypothetical protein n=1 Tax=Streptomyces sp. CBMA29 TaxID=1896314 RepID=UPI001661AEE6|nr:hypothetical protein [Streptomyces sp. CBMA29]MBD0736685.1 hypothetical protein [Streptomyces sp. CBMA29]